VHTSWIFTKHSTKMETFTLRLSLWMLVCRARLWRNLCVLFVVFVSDMPGVLGEDDD
jgi:hypothetical protein